MIDKNNYYSEKDWIREMNYQDSELENIRINPVFGIPELFVGFSEGSYPLFLDFGNSDEIVITHALKDKINYSAIREIETRNADGSFRGIIQVIEIPEIRILGKKYSNVTASLADWKIYASEPFNGMVGMDYFSNMRFTLDYKRRLFASSAQPLSDVEAQNYIKIPLIEFNYHPYGVHFMGTVNGKPSLIYFDTGKSKTFIEKDLVDTTQLISDKGGTYYNGTVPVNFLELSLEIKFPLVKDIKRKTGENYSVGIEVGSDLLKNFIISIDRTGDSNILYIHL